jgi:hypothetical protein
MIPALLGIGKYEKRFVLSTKALKASTINWWGKRRWQIEGWFKIAKHRFGLHRFAQLSQAGDVPLADFILDCLSVSALSLSVYWSHLITRLGANGRISSPHSPPSVGRMRVVD